MELWEVLDEAGNPVFEPGSRFWVRWLSKSDPDWNTYYNQIDDKFKADVDSGKLYVFLTGITAPDGTEYKNFGTVANLYIQLGEDWSVDDFVAEMSRYVWEELSPRLRTKFYRITLVNKDKTERITMDMDLEWENMVNGEKRCYPELVIIEVKRDGRAVCGEGIAISEILRNLRVHPFKISKYCIGTALTNPSLKQNRFKTKIRNIEKLCQN